MRRFTGYKDESNKHSETIKDLNNKLNRLPVHDLDDFNVDIINEKFEKVQNTLDERINELKARVSHTSTYIIDNRDLKI